MICRTSHSNRGVPVKSKGTANANRKTIPDDIKKQADEAPSDCLSTWACHKTCTASYAEGCGAYVGKEKP